MGGAQSHRHRGRRYGYGDHPGSLPVSPEDMFSGYYSSYPVSPTTPMSHLDVDPYFQYPGFPGPMRRGNSDPNLARYDPGYDPYMQYGMMPPGGFDPYEAQDPYAAQGAMGYPPPQAPGMGPRWGSLPNMYDPGFDGHRRGRPLLQKLFGQNSVAQRKNILKKLDQRQMDPFQKTAQWLMQSGDPRRVR